MNHFFRYVLIVTFAILFLTTNAAPFMAFAGDKSQYTVTPATSKIRVDGVLNENAWKEALIIPLPYEFYPGENIPAEIETQCRVTFTSTHLYAGFTCADPEPRKIRAHYMERDDAAGFKHEDTVFLYIDPFNDERRSYRFQVNPLGVQVDAFRGEEQGTDYSWDAAWKSAGKITGSGYTVEIAIPFHQLRFPKTEGPMTWGLSAKRYYPRNVYRRFSSHIVDRGVSCAICQFNKISGFQGITPGRDLEISPTLTGSRTDTRENTPPERLTKGNVKAEPGISLRWGITPNLSLNAAVNPDFSNIEADVAQLNINRRYALYYPEKRPFFLEGADFFKTPIRAVFTRTVASPRWGIKFSGKSGKNSTGIFLARDRMNNLIFPSNQGSTAASLDQDTTSAVIRYKRDIGKGSTLGILYTGRMGDDYHNHVVGTDSYLRLNKKTTFRFQFLHSETDYPDQTAANFQQETGPFGGNALYAGLRCHGRTWAVDTYYKDIGAGFREDNGFISRADIRQFRCYVQQTIWGKKDGWFNQVGFYEIVEKVWDHQGQTTDSSYELGGFYYGPFNSFLDLSYLLFTEYYEGISHNLGKLLSYFSINPRKGLTFNASAQIGKSVDYVNNRTARSTLFMPGVLVRFGRHINLDINHTFEHLSHHGEKIYTANLTQARAACNFNTRLSVRCTFQYLDISRDPDNYLAPIESKKRTLFTQLLLSYRLSPQTVLFLGYSDNRFGTKSVDLYRTDRTFFLKIGYSWMM